MTASTYESARATLFRAFLGDEPRPSVEELSAAKRYLGSSPEFCAALDDLVRIIVCDKKNVADGQRLRLQEYVAAQLAGRGGSQSFADIRQQLDASVLLSEEYALLYETMQAELQGALPTPHEIPAPDLSFLVRPAGVASKVSRLSVQPPQLRLAGLFTAISLVVAFSALNVLGLVILRQTGVIDGTRSLLILSVIGLVATIACIWLGRQDKSVTMPLRRSGMHPSWLVVALAVFIAAWYVLAPNGSQLSKQSIERVREPAPPHSYLAFHLRLEQQLPTRLAIYRTHPAPRTNQPCIDFDHGLFYRLNCPL